MSLLPKSEDKKFVLAALYSICTPIIVTPGAENDMDNTMKEKYKFEAILNIKEIFQKEEAPDYHVLTWLSFASLTVAPSPIFTKIQLQLGKKFFGDKTDFITEEKLDPYEQKELKKLGHWIFKEQIKHLKQNLKEGKNQ